MVSSGSILGTAVLKITTDAGRVDKDFDKLERTALKRTRDIGKKMTLADKRGAKWNRRSRPAVRSMNESPA